MKRIIITNPFHGICHMQVCAEKNATDEEILKVCNKENPSGTTNGWSTVLRNEEDPNMNPVKCADNPNRLHLLIQC
jgi:hypothetical protein